MVEPPSPPPAVSPPAPASSPSPASAASAPSPASAAAAADGPPPVSPAAALSAPSGGAVWVYDARGGAQPAPEISGDSSKLLACCPAKGSFAVALSPDGRVRLSGHGHRDRDGFFAEADPYPEGGSAPCTARLPWAAAAVSAGEQFTVALQDGGDAICSWGDAPHCQLGRKGEKGLPGVVPGLPPGDPVSLLQAGGNFVIVITVGDKAFGWGDNEEAQLALGGMEEASEVGETVAIERLTGRTIRSLACGGRFGVAESGAGYLLAWGGGDDLFFQGSKRPNIVRLQAKGIKYPLRSLAAGGTHCAAADAAGTVWLWGYLAAGHVAGRKPDLPEKGSLVAAGASHLTVVLAESGALFDCSVPDTCRSISAESPALPLGLSPCGGCAAARIALAALQGCCFLRASGRDLGPEELSQPLSEFGISAESTLEFLRAPPGGVQPAAAGALTLYVRMPPPGPSDPLCLEVAPDSTVGGVAALAVQRAAAQR
eukprot:TRINITY_DN23220_c0_g1_i1.p1 TRINITY_DN23220_c0_g1~~TRINITY_DN23220_c0_g1_i1.p1  ORF type:complete len:506 (+),score=142.61 TRINITY_DN23220_c0_g1_i1:66-1520(+)